jgi:hypothetical protein
MFTVYRIIGGRSIIVQNLSYCKRAATAHNPQVPLLNQDGKVFVIKLLQITRLLQISLVQQ